MDEYEPPRKRLRTGYSVQSHIGGIQDEEDKKTVEPNAPQETNRSLLTVPISPPTTKRALKIVNHITLNEHLPEQGEPASSSSSSKEPASSSSKCSSAVLDSTIPSPIHLTHVENLSHENNIDTITLKDIVGDPLIRECWVFNFLFDVEFLM